MHDTVLKLAVAVIVATAVLFLLSTTFSQLGDSANSSVDNLEDARRTSLEKSVLYLQ